MTARLIPSILLALALAGPALAWPNPRYHSHHAPAPDCEEPIPEKITYRRQVLLVPHEEATTLPKLTLRTVECERVPGGPVLDFHEERRTVCEKRVVTRVEDRQVVCTECKAVLVKDPCTGKCYFEKRTCEVVKTVKVKVSDVVPVNRTVVVRVPTLKCGPDIQIKRLALDSATVPAVRRTYSAAVTDSPVRVPVIPQCVKVPPPLCRPVGPPPCLAAESCPTCRGGH